MALAYRSTEVYLQPDVKYKSKMVSKFINSLMRKGKKSVAEKVFYGAMGVIGKKITDVEPLEIFETAVNNVKPLVEVRSKRVGGSYDLANPLGMSADGLCRYWHKVRNAAAA